MSDGLRLLSSIIATGSSATLMSLERSILIDDEVTAYDFVKGHFRSYRELPSAQTVLQECGVRLPVVNETLQFYIDKVHGRNEYSLIRARFSTLRDGLTSMRRDVMVNAVQEMARILGRTGHGSHAGEVVDINYGLQRVTDRLVSIRGTGGVSGITTGWPRYDMITGGYQNSDLITLVGRMSEGKSYIALRQAQMAHRNGESVLFVTTEMSIEQTARRYAALELGLNPTFLRNGTISTHMERRLRSLVTDVAGADRFRLFSVGMNAKVSAIEALCEEYRPSVVFIDGVYLLKPTDRQRNATQRDNVAGVYDELRALNLEADIPFICTTQFNRQAGKGGKDGSLETIAYADAIGTHSSIVVSLRGGPTENARDSRTFHFLKGREGEAGEVHIRFQFAPLNMDEIESEDQEENGISDSASAWTDSE